MKTLSLLFLSAVAATGCYATTTTGYTPAYVGPTVAVTATTVEPDLVYVSPGVQVIADFDEPIFYSNGFYWRETGGIWYRSTYYTGGWAYAAPPTAVISIRDRRSYSHYRPAGYIPRRDRAIVRDNRGYNRGYDRPVVRENRGYRPAPVVRDNRSYQPAARPAPVVRDNRTYHPAPAPAPAARPVVRDNRKRDHK